MSNESPAPNSPRYPVGHKVRVRAGISDPENPDVPIGRWCGTVEEIDLRESPPVYLVRWDRRTRDNMAPVFVKRCQRDDLEIDIMWLDDTDLEDDDGAQLPIEQPAQTITPALSEDDQDDRVRAIFNLTSDDALPEVDEGTLRIYHAHLKKHLTFPFKASWEVEDGPLESSNQSTTVRRLLPPEDIDPEDGILCEVKGGGEDGVVPLSSLELDDETPRGRLLADYSYWVHNYPGDADVLPFPPVPASMEGPGPVGLNELPVSPGPSLRLRRVLHLFGLGGCVYGATLGAILATHEAARLGMSVGAVAFAFLLGLTGRRYGMLVGAMNQYRRGPLLGGLIGLLAGVVVGSLVGAMAVAFVGTLSGSIAGTILGNLFAPQGRKPWFKFLGGTLGACAGGIILALTIEREQALMGMLVGAGVGILAAILLVLIGLFTLAMLMTRRG